MTQQVKNLEELYKLVGVSRGVFATAMREGYIKEKDFLRTEKIIKEVSCYFFDEKILAKIKKYKENRKKAGRKKGIKIST